MVVLVQANLLAVGIKGMAESLRELPVRVVEKRSGRQAAACFRNEGFDAVISNWELSDMPKGAFLRRLKAFRPGIATIAFVNAGDRHQEIDARCTGVSAVVTDKVSDLLLKETVANVLRLEPVESIQATRDKGAEKT